MRDAARLLLAMGLCTWAILFLMAGFAFAEGGKGPLGLQATHVEPVLQASDDDAKAPARCRISKVGTSAAGTVAVSVVHHADDEGYEYLFAKDRRFKKSVVSKVTAKQSIKVSWSITPKKCYVKARAYRVVGGKKIWGAWSSVQAVVTKRLKIAVVGSTSSGAGGWLKRNGCKVVRVKSSKVDPNKFDGLVIPGGNDVDPAIYGAKRHKRTYGVDHKFDMLQIRVVKKFVHAEKPVLGVCRGNQLVNVALGGTLFQHIPGWHKGSRTVKIKKGSWLYGLFGSRESVSHYHHQCVLKLGKGLVATQWDAKDGRVEAFEHETLPVYGLQWHPEGMGKRGRAVARKFMNVCARCNRSA